MEKQKISKNWSRKEILGLIKCYAARKNDFLRRKERKVAYENVLKDMVYQRLTNSRTTVTAIIDKMCRLCTEYKWAKRSNGHFSYMTELEEVFGDNPIIPVVDVLRGERSSTEGANDCKQEQVSHSEGDASDTQDSSPSVVGTEAVHKKRKHWYREETLALIKCYAARKHEFLNSKKKKAAYANVLKDMIEQKLTDPSTTIGAVEDKLYNLRNTYRLAQSDNSRAPYMTELKEVFGDLSNDPPAHTLHVGRGPIKFLNDPQQSQLDDTKSNEQPVPLGNIGKDMTGNSRRKRRVWTQKETLGLIKCYAERRHEFLRARKKIIAYANVHRDMTYQKLIDPSVPVVALADKMQTLHSAYMLAKSRNTTGPYMKELEEVFGENSTATGNAHTTNFLNDLRNQHPHFENVLCSEDEVSDTPSNAPQTRSTGADSTRLTSTSRIYQRYYDKKLELMKEAMQAKLVQRAEFFKEMKSLFEERFRKEDELRKEEERRRLELLEIILGKKLLRKEGIDVETIKMEYD